MMHTQKPFTKHDSRRRLVFPSSQIREGIPPVVRAPCFEVEARMRQYSRVPSRLAAASARTRRVSFVNMVSTCAASASARSPLPLDS